MNNIILDALDYFFPKRLESGTTFKITSEIFETMPIAIVNGTKMRYNVLGIINSKKEFIWAWYLNIAKNKFVKSKKLLIYAIEKEVCTLQDAYIKTILTTGKQPVYDETNLIIMLSLATYLTKAHFVIAHDIDGYTEIYGLYEL